VKAIIYRATSRGAVDLEFRFPLETLLTSISVALQITSEKRSAARRQHVICAGRLIAKICGWRRRAPYDL
jgi:hypothetical protein